MKSLTEISLNMLEKRMNLAEANKLGLLKNDYGKEEKNNVKE